MQLKLSGPTTDRRANILAHLQEFGEKCSDNTIKLDDLHLGYDGDRYHLKMGAECLPLDLSSHAELQLLARLKIPAAYFHRCPGNLQHSQLKHWLHTATNKDKEMVFRMIRPNLARAVVSQRYVAMDDLNIMPLILDTLSAKTDLHIRSFYKDNDFTLLRSLFTEMMVTSPNDSERHYWAGVEVCNSETGMSALWIAPLIRTGSRSTARAYDLVDRHGIAAGTRLLHINQKEPATIQIAIELALKTAQAAIAHLITLETEVVTNPSVFILDWTKQADFLPNRLMNILAEEYEAQQEATKLAIAERILEAVKNLPVFTKRLAEAEVGRFLHLFQDTEERIQGLVEVFQQVQTVEPQ